MEKVKCVIEKRQIPTYPEPPTEELPMFAENRVHQRTSGRPYPNKVVLKVDREHRVDKEYQLVILENEYLKIEILPQIVGILFQKLARPHLLILILPLKLTVKTAGYLFSLPKHMKMRKSR